VGKEDGARGGIQVKEIWLCFQIIDRHPLAILSNKNTNKIFLWIGSVPNIVAADASPGDVGHRQSLRGGHHRPKITAGARGTRYAAYRQTQQPPQFT
jgi:hypothetical protein